MLSDPIGPHLRTRLMRLLGAWARREQHLFPTIQRPTLPEDVPIEWVADFIALVEANVRAGDPWQPLDWQFELGMPFGELLNAVVLTNAGRKETIRSLLRNIVAPDVARAVVAQALWPCTPSSADEREVTCCLSESGSRDKNALAHKLTRAGAALAIADLVVECAERELAAKTLRSLFYAPVPDSGFRAWDTSTWTGYGVNESVKTVSIPGGSLEVKWARYLDVDPCPVKAFEWNAQLRSDGVQADAGAAGMIYTFPRHGRTSHRMLRELIRASDAVADTDVLQVSAFINQHPDAAALVKASDLCFVWVWERRADAPKGTGTRCLLEAIAVLRSQFASLKTLVVCVAPGQFYPCGPIGEPAQIAFHRLEAVDKVASLVDGVAALTGMNVRGIVNRHEGSIDSATLAMMALADPQLVR